MLIMTMLWTVPKLPKKLMFLMCCMCRHKGPSLVAGFIIWKLKPRQEIHVLFQKISIPLPQKFFWFVPWNPSLRPPSPLGILKTFHDRGMDIFWNHTVIWENVRKKGNCEEQLTSTDCRPTVGQQSADSWLIVSSIVLAICRSTDSGLSVTCRPTVGYLSVEIEIDTSRYFDIYKI